MFFDPSCFSPGDRVLAAVSGGADSLALLHALVQGREALGLTLFAAHVHHGMRGDEADADVEFLNRACAGWNVPFLVERVGVPLLAKRQRISVEEAGRNARYSALEKLAREHSCTRVVTAHTADDQAETLLLNLFRGTGIDGLAGIPARRPLSGDPGAPEVVRPILHRWRRETEAYCAEHALHAREDRTNRDLRYRRSRIRYELLPRLRDYDPDIKSHLVRLAGQAREERDLLNDAASALLAAVRVESESDETPRYWLPHPAPLTPAFRAQPLREAPPALARRALRIALREAAGYDLELDAALVARMSRLIEGQGPMALDLPGCGLRARLRGECLVLEAREPGWRASAPVEVRVPGRSASPAFGFQFEISEAPVPSDRSTTLREALFDADALCGPLTLRSSHDAERFQPLGSPGRKLVRDLLSDRKVPAGIRQAWPVVADDLGIVWVVGVAIAHRVRVQDATRRCFLAVASPAPGVV